MLGADKTEEFNYAHYLVVVFADHAFGDFYKVVALRLQSVVFEGI